MYEWQTAPAAAKIWSGRGDIVSTIRQVIVKNPPQVVASELETLMRWGDRSEILRQLIGMAKAGNIEAMRLYFELSGEIQARGHRATDRPQPTFAPLEGRPARTRSVGAGARVESSQSPLVVRPAEPVPARPRADKAPVAASAGRAK